MNACRITTAWYLGACLAALLLPASSLAGKYNPTLSIGDQAPAWEKLPGIDDKLHSFADLKDKDVVVVAFTCNSCPYAVDYEDRLIALAKKYSGSDSRVAVVAINVNTVPDDRLPKMKERAESKQFPFPYLYDESQQIARKFGASYTPEFFVLDRQRKVVYMGAFDDSPDSEKIEARYVQPAIDAALSGNKPPVEETIAIGCAVRYKRSRRSR